MVRKIAGSVQGSFDSLFHLGQTADLSDGQLLDRVDHSQPIQAEVAFAALVARHGPMVLRICRDVIGNPHDAEDACQAVFLILARRAGSIRNRESVATWLFGVARRVAIRARRDAARRREHEQRRAELATHRTFDIHPIESWPELYEEIDRLPSRDRGAVVLCHLEGLSHDEAAIRLQCPVRTLQSRLLRARGKLRDRLTRRGVTTADGVLAILAPGSAHLAPQISMSLTIARHALLFSTGQSLAGTVPASVSSLAEGVLRMSLVTRLKVVSAALIALGLTAGFAWAAARGRGEVPAEPLPSPVVAPATPPADPVDLGGKLQARGIVVDEQGRPVPGVEVVALAFTSLESSAVTGADGSFAVPIRGERELDGQGLLARAPDATRMGSFRYDWNLTPTQAATPAQIVLQPGRAVAVRVIGIDKAPVPGAMVEMIGNYEILAAQTTGADGSSRLVVPVEARVDWVVALKGGQGIDYAEFGPIDDTGQMGGGVVATDLPPAVNLALDGARTAQIQALDHEGKPLAGIRFSPWLIKKNGRRSELNLGDNPAFAATTDSAGVATFAYLPSSQGGLTFWPQTTGYAHRRVTIGADTPGPVTARMARTEAIRGRVVRPDGSPAGGIELRAMGNGAGSTNLDTGNGWARTAADGSYEMMVPPDEGYAVAVDDKDLVAPSRLDVRVRQGEPATGVDFRLGRGTLIRGSVTMGTDGRPVLQQMISFDQTGEQGPVATWENGEKHSKEIRRQFSVMTDAQGHYSIRVAPGTYSLFGPMRAGTETLVVRDEAELVRDFRMPRAEKGPMTGRVVAAATNQPLAGAKVDIVAVNNRSVPTRVTTDEAGRFETERWLDPLVVHAQSADGSLGAIVEVGLDEAEVTISLAPTATATGLLLDEQGQPAAKQQLFWGRRVYVDSKKTLSMTCFGPKVTTDSAGKFFLPGLVVGQEYEIGVMRGNSMPQAGVVRPATPSPIELGTIQVGHYHPPQTAEEMSSFHPGGLKAGDLAPPIEATTLDGQPLRLADFRGKFVLLDFWATWCGPCIGEIPQLRMVYEDFGKDGRLTILSLSVDEKIAEPKQFQEGRKLPWTQGYLGGGFATPTFEAYGIRAIPAFVLVGPDGKIVAKGMRDLDIRKEVARAVGEKP